MRAISEFANVDTTASIGENSQVWDYTQIRENVVIGSSCVVGRNVYIGPGVSVGNNCKIQNNSSIYDPATIANGVFIGPNVTLTNDRHPRSVNPNGSIKSQNDWKIVGIDIQEGASIGAGSICVAPARIGKWSLIGAGSVITKDVPNYALMVGNPATQIGWVSKTGKRLVKNGEFFTCSDTDEVFKLENQELVEIDNNA
jgi:UDP-2-acetamido-3-amino-2,3-dideoxy-glucuronate N-acetyltransferase